MTTDDAEICERQYLKFWMMQTLPLFNPFLSSSKSFPFFFIDYGENSLTHIFHIDTYIFVGVEQKFHQIFWRTPYFLFLSLKSNFCISFRPLVSSSINAETDRFFLFFSWQLFDKTPTCLISLFHIAFCFALVASCTTGCMWSSFA